MDELLLNPTALALLDTPAEERFDRLTRLARIVANTPFSLLTVLTPERQWFKSAQGTTICQTPAEISFCVHTLRHGQTLVLENLHLNEEHCQNPVVCGAPNLKFYAGVPLRSPSGEWVGTLCTMDVVERSITSQQLQGLEDLARVAESELGINAWSPSEQRLLAGIAAPARSSLLDEATRCWNQAAILNIASQELERSAEHKRNLSLLILSTDLADPELARSKAEKLRQRLASYQTVGRLDESSFLVILPERTPHECRALAQEFQQQTEGRAYLMAGDLGPCQTDQLFNQLQKALTNDHRDLTQSGPPLSLRSLGPFQLDKEGQSVPHSGFRTQKNRLLLAYLAGCPQRQANVDVLLDEFWPTGGDGARSSLRGALSTLRQVLRVEALPGDPLERNGNFVQLADSQHLWSDTEAFLRLADSSREEDLNQALQLYHGAYLEGDYEDWVLRRRDQLHEQFLAASFKLAQQSFARHDFPAAAQVAEKALELAPERQDLNAILFRSWLRLGKGEQVSKRYRALEKELRLEFGVEPSLELVELFHRAELGLSA